MKTVLRYQSLLLLRRSYKPERASRNRSLKPRFTFRPLRFGLKPKIKTVP